MKYLLNLEKFKINDDYRGGIEALYYVESEKIFEPIRKILEKDCSKFIQEMKDNWTNVFWRGESIEDSEEKNIIISRKVRKDRYPRDMDKQIQDMFDFYSRKHFNKNLRGSGVFTTKVKGDCYEYGTPFIFFPKGDYEYYWNPDVSDLFSDLEYHPLAVYYLNRHDNTLTEIFEDEWDIFSNSNYTKEDEDLWFEEKSHKAISMFEDHIDEIVRRYRKGSVENIKYQETIFLCDEYYLINSEYLKFVHQMFDIESTLNPS